MGAEYRVAAVWIAMALAAVRLKQSVALVEILVGVAAGNFVLYLTRERALGLDGALQVRPRLLFLAGFGSVLLTFLAGAEIEPDVLRRHYKESLAIGLASFAAPFVAATLFARYVSGWEWDAALICGIALSTTSVAVVYAVMVETGLDETEIGKVILAACFAHYDSTLLVFVTVMLSPLLANIALHGLEDLFHEWSVTGRSRDRMEVVETFSAPPSGYRKCRPENARVSLRGPQRPRKTNRREPPKVYGPYPDGSGRTLRLVPNDSRTRTSPGLRRDPGLRDLRLIRYADGFVVLARARRQLERVVLPNLREFLAARGLLLSDEKTRIVRDTEGFDFVGRQFKRLSPTKFLARPRRRSVRAHRDALLALFRNHVIPVGHQIRRANAIIRGFCNHFRTDHSGRTFKRLTFWALRSFCKWVSRRGGRLSAGQAYHRLTRVSGHRFSVPTAYTPEGRPVTLLAHTRFHRVRHQQVKGTNSPLDPRLTDYWEERRERSLLRRLVADGNRRRRYLLRRQQNRCAITGLPIADVSQVEIHHIIPTHVGGNDDWSNLCLVFPWAHTALHARHQGDYSRAPLNDVPFSGI